MRVSDIRTLYEYTDWANQRLLNTALQATSEQWLAPGTAGRGSIRDTLTHMVGGQRMWLSWWDGTGEADPGLRTALDPERYADADALRAAWDVVHRATLRYIDTLSDADLLVEHVRPLGKVEALRLPLWQMMLHITSHNTQHRSEAAAMLTAFGHSPGELDLLRYLVPALL